MDAAPLHDDIADAPPGGRAVWLRADDGVRLRMAHWPVGPRGAVMIFPGRTEVIEKYGRVVADLAAAGYGAFLIDWRGQGLSDRAPRSDPLLGHLDDFALFQTDVAAYAAAVAELGGGRAPCVLAHSMGGCIALRALTGGLAARAVVFGSPMWGIPLGSVLRRGVRVLRAAGRWAGVDRRMIPGAGIEFRLWENPFDDNELTTDRGQYDWMQAQVNIRPELRLGAPTIGWLAAALAETAALAALPSPAVPVFCGLGGDERIVDPVAIRARMADWPGGTLVEYPGAAHELLMERPAVRQDFLARAFALFDAHPD